MGAREAWFVSVKHAGNQDVLKYTTLQNLVMLV